MYMRFGIYIYIYIHITVYPTMIFCYSSFWRFNLRFAKSFFDGEFVLRIVIQKPRAEPRNRICAGSKAI